MINLEYHSLNLVWDQFQLILEDFHIIQRWKLLKELQKPCAYVEDRPELSNEDRPIEPQCLLCSKVYVKSCNH